MEPNDVPSRFRVKDRKRARVNRAYCLTVRSLFSHPPSPCFSFSFFFFFLRAGAILRCSQPQRGVWRRRNADDEELFEKISQACSPLRRAGEGKRARRLVIVDARSVSVISQCPEPAECLASACGTFFQCVR